jgi:hypothetical protein
MRKLFLVLLAVFISSAATASADLKPWQVPVNNSGVQDQYIDCLADLDKSKNVTLDCVARPQYLPSWSPRGKRIRIF